MSMEKVVAQLNSKNGKQNSINTIFNLYWSIRIIIIYWLDCGSDIKKYNIIFKVNMFILFLLIHFIFIYIYIFFCCLWFFRYYFITYFIHQCERELQIEYFYLQPKKGIGFSYSNNNKKIWKLLLLFPSNSKRAFTHFNMLHLFVIQ